MLSVRAPRTAGYDERRGLIPAFRFRLADVATVPEHIRTIGADPNGIHPGRCEHTNVLLSDERIAVIAIRHTRGGSFALLDGIGFE
jgi:hypothetical protein